MKRKILKERRPNSRLSRKKSMEKQPSLIKRGILVTSERMMLKMAMKIYISVIKLKSMYPTLKFNLTLQKQRKDLGRQMSKSWTLLKIKFSKPMRKRPRTLKRKKKRNSLQKLLKIKKIQSLRKMFREKLFLQNQENLVSLKVMMMMMTIKKYFFVATKKISKLALRLNLI